MNRLPIFTTAQLRAVGMGQRDVDLRIRQGSLTRLRRGSYAEAQQLEAEAEHLRLIRATVAAVDGSNVVSHQSAAILHGLPVPRDLLEKVSMTRRTTGHGDAGPLLRVRRTRLDDAEVTELDGLVVTTLARTASDLARTSAFEWGVAACDAALAKGLRPADLIGAIHRHPRLHGRRQAILAAQFADGRAESPAESISRARLARAGLPAPLLQQELFNSDGEFVAKPDFLWPGLNLVGEVDGRWKYGQLLRPGATAVDAIMAEKRREEAIRQLGYWIVRWDWASLWPGDDMIRRVSRAMELQGRRA